MAQSPSFLGINSLNFMGGLPFPKPRPPCLVSSDSACPNWNSCFQERHFLLTYLESKKYQHPFGIHIPLDQSNNQNNHNNIHNNHFKQTCIYIYVYKITWKMIALLTNISPNLIAHTWHPSLFFSAPKIRFFPAGRRHRRPKKPLGGFWGLGQAISWIRYKTSGMRCLKQCAVFDSWCHGALQVPKKNSDDRS